MTHVCLDRREDRDREISKMLLFFLLSILCCTDNLELLTLATYSHFGVVIGYVGNSRL
jgi:hypothetical protein